MYDMVCLSNFEAWRGLAPTNCKAYLVPSLLGLEEICRAMSFEEACQN